MQMKWNLALELLHKRRSSENPTKTLRSRLHFAFLVLLTPSCWSIVNAQIVPRQDSYTNAATPTTNYGAKTLLDVDAATQTAYIQFDLSSIPSGASISQATLKLYVNSVVTAGSFNVDYVNGAWAESTISASLASVTGTEELTPMYLTDTR